MFFQDYIVIENNQTVIENEIIQADVHLTARDKDQFYTSKKVAKRCYDIAKTVIDLSNCKILEPAAGTGAFFSLFPEGRRLGYDIDPKCDGVFQKDFLELRILDDGHTPYVVIGNPPFGKNASLAVKFFNYAANFSNVAAIAFIFPKTFRKASITNRLNLKFHCVFDEALEANAFVFEGKEYDVPCVFQIWERQDSPRTKHKTLSSHPHFEFLGSAQGADVSIQRVGGDAGRIREEDFHRRSESSHFFLKLNHKDALTRLKQIDFESVKFNTAGNPSISKSEVIELYNSMGAHLETSTTENFCGDRSGKFTRLTRHRKFDLDAYAEGIGRHHARYASATQRAWLTTSGERWEMVGSAS